MKGRVSVRKKNNVKYFDMNKKQGFTLIEMLVVVAIIGLLSSVVVVGLGSARSKARDAKRIADVQQIMASAEVAYTGGSYPASVTAPSTPQSGELYFQDTTNTNTVFRAGACLENAENATGNITACPTGMTCATGQRTNYYCKSTSQ